jgi:hypothetical protein
MHANFSAKTPFLATKLEKISKYRIGDREIENYKYGAFGLLFALVFSQSQSNQENFISIQLFGALALSIG